MRIIRLFLLLLVLFFGLYALSMLWTKDSTEYEYTSELPYPIEKVYPQFNHLQRFVSWNKYFKDSPTMVLQFFRPYEGQGASLSFNDPKSSRDGELYLRYENPYSTLRYQLLEGKEERPYLIDIKFDGKTEGKTKIHWKVHTPKRAYLERSVNWFSDNEFGSSLEESLKLLENTLGNKVDKELLLTQITYDSLMVEERTGELLLGLSVNSTNRGNDLLKNIELNHGKAYNFVTIDMQKGEDEIGFPVLLTDPESYKLKETSYYYGFPVKKRSGLSDNNFSFRSLSPSKMYVMYYKGPYLSRKKAIETLVSKAKKDTMRYGSLEETFLASPNSDQDVHLKIALPVFR